MRSVPPSVEHLSHTPQRRVRAVRALASYLHLDDEKRSIVRKQEALRWRRGNRPLAELSEPEAGVYKR
jgi:hypothetical protein